MSTGAAVGLTVTHKTYPTFATNRPQTADASVQAEVTGDISTPQAPPSVPSTISSLDLTPTRKVTVSRRVPASLTKQTRGTYDRNICHVCKGAYVAGEESDMWVGCSHRGARGRQICQWWCHQRCVRLRCSTAEELSRIPIFCPQHL